MRMCAVVRSFSLCVLFSLVFPIDPFVGQKECDVLWLYGPLYEVSILHKHDEHKHNRSSTAYSNHKTYKNESDLRGPPLERVCFPTPSPDCVHSPPQSPPSDLSDTEALISTLPADEAAAAATPDTVVEASEATESPEATADATPTESAVDSLSTASQPAETLATSAASTAAPKTSSSEECSSVFRPPKPALKRQRTRTQVFEDLRAFTHSPQYLALSNTLAAITFDVEADTASAMTLSYAEGARSEPISPVSSNTSPAFLLPIFSAPTKYHFRSQDRRRASFPKSASHPSRLNLNVNLNLGINIQANGTEGETMMLSPASARAAAKQLRFSLEVQELIFLPSSPPFRISRAKPTRAHSDPAIQSTTCSSFIAPSHVSIPASIRPGQGQQNGNLISTAAASATSNDNTTTTTTTFIKVKAQDSFRLGKASSSSPRLYLQQDDDDEEDLPECNFNDDFHDGYYFDDCHEGYDEDDDDLGDEEDDEFNGVTRGRTHRLRLSKDAIVARRAEQHHRKHQPGMLWQVYTAVTGVKELIAWYGSMVYHSSSL
ncbi:hypothetical protein BC939DRAFT_439458 [Gamsiella multidivaricata]|uniref:uncharacterized protein n=1 Tax=Gamsiella multidivaricata TaxID=101098 RepID=UPI00221EFE54|nr:uncharacterized protein BC939DRAFT_439458 [Gamsiella multidivaricata]KAI7830478.1 hypothetical protein BC939DRAFT_439458 [Gamsiella multidivaricata]